ncbi:EAL domain-containing protein [Jeongeupia sp. USM3]|uniref:EAL domain-containing protein n=1 Tax=Jeongeupia sp. USM3 TaxID=1906741 RepID=UPI00089DD8B2|nr:EAL domain-containing protein [Jeongeupia sp. USM3]AOY02070.1 hypothetical protein BJP62_17460 [Jeongeupia sp. USM3]
MPVSRSTGYEAKRWLVLGLTGLAVLAATNFGLYRLTQYGVRQELGGVAAALAQRVASAQQQSREMADDVHRRSQAQAQQVARCDGDIVRALGSHAGRMPYVQGFSVLKGGQLVCTSLPGTAQAQIDGMLGRLLSGNAFQAGSPLNLDTPGLLDFHAYSDGYNVLNVLQAAYFFDLLRSQDPLRYRRVVLRIKGTYLSADQHVDTYLPVFRNEWESVSIPGGAQVYVEADDQLRWLYMRDSLVTWNVIAIGVLWLLFVFSRRLTSRERAFNRALRKAIATRTIVPYYQPVFSLPEQSLIGVEMLARWPLPDGRFVAPDRFIAHAESNGLISELTHLLIVRMIEDLPLLALPAGARLGLNLSHEALTDDALLEHVEHWGRVLREHGVQPVIEVTERGFVAISQTEQINAVFGRLRDGGIQIALDDFGAEYSSLGYLHRFRFDFVKIDGLFLDGVGKSREVECVLDSVLSMASMLDLKVVVEKVETPVQLAYLNRRKVDAAQGYYFGRPASVDGWRNHVRLCSMKRSDCGTGIAECEPQPPGSSVSPCSC